MYHIMLSRTVDPRSLAVSPNLNFFPCMSWISRECQRNYMTLFCREMQLNLIKTCTVYIPVFKKYSSFVLLIMLIRDFQIFSQIDAQICVFRQVDNVYRSGLRLKILQNKNFVRIISRRHLFKCCFYISCRWYLVVSALHNSQP